MPKYRIEYALTVEYEGCFDADFDNEEHARRTWNVDRFLDVIDDNAERIDSYSCLVSIEKLAVPRRCGHCKKLMAECACQLTLPLEER